MAGLPLPSNTIFCTAPTTVPLASVTWAVANVVEGWGRLFSAIMPLLLLLCGKSNGAAMAALHRHKPHRIKAAFCMATLLFPPEKKTAGARRRSRKGGPAPDRNRLSPRGVAYGDSGRKFPWELF